MRWFQNNKDILALAKLSMQNVRHKCI